MCSWHFAIRERNLIHSLYLPVTEFNSSAIIPAIIHIQNMTLLTCQAWTERCFAVFVLKLILNRRLFLFTILGYVGAKLVVYQ